MTQYKKKVLLFYMLKMSTTCCTRYKMNPVLPHKIIFLIHFSLVFLQHDGDLFTLEVCEDKLNQLPAGMWRKLTAVCDVVFALSIPKFNKIIL